MLGSKHNRYFVHNGTEITNGFELSGRGMHPGWLQVPGSDDTSLGNRVATPVRSSELLGGKQRYGHLVKQAINYLELSFIEAASDGIQKHSTAGVK